MEYFLRIYYENLIEDVPLTDYFEIGKNKQLEIPGMNGWIQMNKNTAGYVVERNSAVDLSVREIVEDGQYIQFTDKCYALLIRAESELTIDLDLSSINDMVIGRGADCRLQLPSRSYVPSDVVDVSRYHASASRRDTCWEVAPIKESAKVYLNGNVLQKPALVTVHDILCLGKYTIQLKNRRALAIVQTMQYVKEKKLVPIQKYSEKNNKKSFMSVIKGILKSTKSLQSDTDGNNLVVSQEDFFRIEKKVESDYAPWSVVRKLGEGLLGEVYEIQKREYGEIRKAALKVISISASEENNTDDNRIVQYIGRKDILSYQRTIDTLTQEFHVLSKLKGHPNIVEYEDHRIMPYENGKGWNFYIRMELLVSLSSYAFAHVFTKSEVIKIGIDICNALEQCEKYSIIHCDVKPDNIFISQDGNYKLGGFKISQSFDDMKTDVAGENLSSYIAPEVYKGEECDFTADIYSLGLILYQYLNNKCLPFVSAISTAIDQEMAFRRRINGVAFTYPAHADEELAQVILTACAYQPANRYQTAGEMKHALVRLICK